MPYSLPKRHVSILFVAIGALTLSACTSTKRLLKAKPGDISPFIEDASGMKRMKKGPFQFVWTSAPREQVAQSSGKSEIVIRPVVKRYLRPIGQTLVRKEMETEGSRRPVDAVSRDMVNAFAEAFSKSPNPRYRPVSRPGPNSVVLELALVELDPTSVRGNVVKKAAGFVVGPLAGLGGRFTKGSIAIEGKLRDARTGWLLFQFADREQDKITFWSLRDFKPYGHTKVAIREWARQFERLTRDPNWRENLKDGAVFTLNPL